MMKSTLRPLLLAIPWLLGFSIGEYVLGDDTNGIFSNTTPSTNRTPHPPGLPTIWKGRNVSELVARLGEPDVILDTAVRGIVIYGDTPSVMYVYGSTSGPSFDAYVVEHDTGEILAYHRR